MLCIYAQARKVWFVQCFASAVALRSALPSLVEGRRRFRWCGRVVSGMFRSVTEWLWGPRWPIMPPSRYAPN